MNSAIKTARIIRGSCSAIQRISSTTATVTAPLTAAPSCMVANSSFSIGTGPVRRTRAWKRGQDRARGSGPDRLGRGFAGLDRAEVEHRGHLDEIPQVVRRRRLALSSTCHEKLAGRPRGRSRSCPPPCRRRGRSDRGVGGPLSRRQARTRHSGKDAQARIDDQRANQRRSPVNDLVIWASSSVGRNRSPFWRKKAVAPGRVTDVNRPYRQQLVGAARPAPDLRVRASAHRPPTRM